MPTRKQRRRRAKEFRHEYIWEDAEGNELEADKVRERPSGAQPRRIARTGREPQRPSLTRTLKRAAIFAPIMFFIISLLSKDLSIADRIVQTALVVLVFIPFSYFLDGLFWRSYQRRVGRVEHSGRRGN
jgi:hypothetical protein